MSLTLDTDDQRLLHFRKLLIAWIKELPWWKRLLNKF